jgi:FMN phosphatase YigB (HAD superfamily)
MFKDFYFTEDQNFKIYVDLDGVLCNWEKEWHKLSDLGFDEYRDKYGNRERWKLIEDQGIEFWSMMEWKEDGHKLWDYLKPFYPTILSSPSRSQLSRDGKMIWTSRELGDDVKVILERDKHKYACPNCILIDDTVDKINKWQEAGGIGILHKNADDTIEAIGGLLI